MPEIEFDLEIQQGLPGPPNALSIGSVTTAETGVPASAAITGTAPTQVLDLTLPKGNTGLTGPQGDKGDTGNAATISVGTVTTGAAGSSAAVTNAGTAGAAVLNFSLPRGDKGEVGEKGDKGDLGNTGPANTLSIAGVTTGAPGTNASASVGGTSPNQTLSLTIPRGDVGAKGDKGDQGIKGDAATITLGTVSTGAAGSSVSITQTGTPGDAVFNFAIPRGDKGETGSTGPIGPANTLSIAGVTTGAAGSSASVTVGGTAPNQTLSFTIPQGNQGPQGIQGPQGDTSVIPVTTVSGTTATITPTSAGTKHRFTSTTGCAITIQAHATAAWTVGQIIYFRRTISAGALTWNNSGITIMGDKLSLIQQGEEFALQNIATDTFDFI